MVLNVVSSAKLAPSKVRGDVGKVLPKWVHHRVVLLPGGSVPHSEERRVGDETPDVEWV